MAQISEPAVDRDAPPLQNSPLPEALTTQVQQGLSADIHLLADLLGAAIRRLAGEEAYGLEEEIRAAAKELRVQPSVEEARRLRDRLDRLALPALRTLIRSFSIYFDLVNLAEQQARARANRLRTLQRGVLPLEESPEAALRQLRDRDISPDQLGRLLERALICPVFTAHPSEARRRTILEKLRTIAAQLDQLEYRKLLPHERDEIVAIIAEEVETLWLTDTVRGQRPTVLDEVRHALQFVESSLLTVVPRFYRQLEEAVQRQYPELAGRRLPTLLRFGSWIGGDRDGHPHVTHKVTAQAIRLQQEMILQHYLQRIEELGGKLSHSDRFVQPTAALSDSLRHDHELFGAESLPGLGIRGDAKTEEPYRTKCRFIAAKLRCTLDYVRALEPRWSGEETPPQPVYLRRENLLTDLRVLAEDLERVGAQSAAAGTVHDLIRLVEVFGLHMVTLDIRQNSARHSQAIEEILAWAGTCPRYGKLSPNERFEQLLAELQHNRPLIPSRLPFSPETCEVVQTFRTLAAVLEQQCPEAVDTYIISNATEPAHLLEVLLLAREARLFQPDEGISRLNIVPLFESLEPLRNAAAIIQRLLTTPVYRRHLALRGDVQEVMIGYSDSNKESGFMQSAWALFQAQRALGEAGRRMGISVQIFHGRGGAIGRGGGPANHAILAQPRGTIDGRLRLTEQGEMIADRYGHAAIAERHLGQVLNAVLRSSFSIDDDRPEPGWERVIERLAELAGRHYRALVYQTDEFLTYFEQATPIAEIGQLKIASRPARRQGTGGIEQLRAIPWVFSWMQSRHTLPGWYGLGSAVSDHLAQHPGDLELLRNMYRRWPFWQTLIDNAQMILAKADLTIARLYADLVADQALAARIFDRIVAEYGKTVEVILAITGQAALLEKVPVLHHSIQRRNPYVDPLSFIQLVILKRLRAGVEPRAELLTAVLESINGIAAGLKNTG